MLNPIQRYFPKLHRLLSTSPEDDAASILLPLDVPALLSRGHALWEQGQPEEAIAHYRHAVQLDPASGIAYQYLAEALSYQGELEESAVCYRRAIELSAAIEKRIVQRVVQVPGDEPEDEAELDWFEAAAFYLQQGDVLCNSSNWAEASQASQQAIELLEPQLAAAYVTAGRAWQQQGDLAAAEQVYGKAIVIQPQDAEAQARLASLYTQQQRLTEAVMQYQQALALQPTFAGAHWSLAQVYQQLGQMAEAAAHCYTALQLNPQLAPPSTHLKLGQMLMAQGELTAAIACFRQTIRLAPNPVAAYHLLGLALGKQGQWEEALVAHRQAVRQNSHPEFQAGLGQALMALQHWQEAADCYCQLIQMQPDSIEGYRGLRDARIKLEQRTEALACAEKLVELQPASSMAYHELGDALNQLRRWDAAASAFRRAIALNPNFSWSHNNLGDVLIHLEEWQAAAESFQAAIALHPTFHWSHYNLGEAFAQQERWDEAINAYRRTIALQPDLPRVHQKLGDALRLRAKADAAEALNQYHHAIDQDPKEVQNYHKAIELHPNNPQLYGQLAEALVQQNQMDGAIAVFQMALQLQPDPAIEQRLTEVREQKQLQQLYPSDRSTDLYDYWVQQNTLTSDDLKGMAKAVKGFAYRPLISVLMPTYNTPELFLREAIESVLHQVYPHWELCIADDASTQPHVKKILADYAAQDDRIKLSLRQQNGHIAAASNSALRLATGEFVALLDHDDVITPDALYQVVTLLNQHPEADMIYSDEDKLNEQGQRTNPFFKPDWCPDSFLTRMYTCHLGTYRRSLVEQVSGFRVGYEGSQDYDLVLRLTEQTHNIFHIPKILYHWRINAASVASSSDAKPYAYEAAVKAIADALHRRGEGGKVVSNPGYPGTYQVRYAIQAYKRVSIIIPTRNLGKILDRCLESIFSKTTYPNYEVILIDNGSHEPETLKIIQSWQRREGDRFRSYRLDVPFNFSHLNNDAVRRSRGDYFLFLNNDTEVIEPDWIEAMVEQAQRRSIGAVGGLLLYPDDTIQHAGVVLGIGGIAGHSHKHFPKTHPGYFNQVLLTSNYSAVTGACLMCRREVFEAIGGFDEQLSVAFNDVDLCLKMTQQGYQNIYLPHVVLYHHESKSRGYEDTPEKIRRFEREDALMKRKWQSVLQADPCYNPNLTKEREDFTLPLPPLDLEVVAVSRPKTSLIFNCAIDSLKVGQKVSSFYLGIAGWVLGHKSRATAIQVIHKNQVLHTLSVKQPRPDVARVYAMAAAATSGFAGAIATTGFAQTFELTLKAQFEDGSSDILSRIKFQTLAKPR